MVNKLTNKQERVANNIDRELDELEYERDMVSDDIEVFLWKAILLFIIVVILFFLRFIPFFIVVTILIVFLLRFIFLMRRKRYIDSEIKRKYDVLGRITSRIDTRGSEVWQALRRNILKRDNNTCQDCGKRNTFINWFIGKVELHVHHIKPVAKGGSNDSKNLVTLCRSCHKKIHPWMK